MAASSDWRDTDAVVDGSSDVLDGSSEDMEAPDYDYVDATSRGVTADEKVRDDIRRTKCHLLCSTNLPYYGPLRYYGPCLCPAFHYTQGSQCRKEPS